MNINSVFLAGTIQGTNRGAKIVDQDYRRVIRDLFNQYYPLIKIYNPLEIMYEKYGHKVNSLGLLISELSKESIIFPDKINPQLLETTQTFHDLLNLVSTSDLLVAFLPNHEPSMGTAMEILQAYRNNKTIIAITDMNQNLAILATSTVVVSNLNEFEILLKSKWIETL